MKEDLIELCHYNVYEQINNKIISKSKCHFNFIFMLINLPMISNKLKKDGVIHPN